MPIKINTSDFRAWQRRFASSSTKLKAHARAGLVHQTLTQEAFETRGVDPQTGTPGVWPDKQVGDPKKASPKERGKARNFDPTPRLQDTGALVASINAKPNSDGYEIGPAPFPYAPFHQFGAVIPMTPAILARLVSLGFTPRWDKAVVIIPKRQYILLPAPWQNQIMEAYLSERLKGADNGS
jgi:phage gpG-like protein